MTYTIRKAENGYTVDTYIRGSLSSTDEDRTYVFRSWVEVLDWLRIQSEEGKA